MRRFALALLVSLPALAVPGAEPDSVRQTVEAYLGSIDTPISDARWKALGPDAAPLLVAITTGDALPTRRAKALHGLSIVDAAQAAPLARQLATRTDEPLVVRSAAVRAVARTLPPADAVAVLRPLLDASSTPLQRRTADALAQIGAPGCRALQGHVARLSVDARATFAQAMARCPDAASR